MNKSNSRKWVALLALLALGSLAGCKNTWEGMGKDVERGGEKMQNSVKDGNQK